MTGNVLDALGATGACYSLSDRPTGFVDTVHRYCIGHLRDASSSLLGFTGARHQLGQKAREFLRQANSPH